MQDGFQTTWLSLVNAHAGIARERDCADAVHDVQRARLGASQQVGARKTVVTEGPRLHCVKFLKKVRQHCE